MARRGQPPCTKKRCGNLVVIVIAYLLFTNLVFPWMTGGREWSKFLAHISRPIWDTPINWSEVDFFQGGGASEHIPSAVETAQKEYFRSLPPGEAVLKPWTSFKEAALQVKLNTNNADTKTNTNDNANERTNGHDDNAVQDKKKVDPVVLDEESKLWSPVRNEAMKRLCFNFMGTIQKAAPHVKVNPARTRLLQRRRIIDVIQFNGEWALLLMRMDEMLPLVDKMYIFETELGYSGKPKNPQWWSPGGVDQIAEFAAKHGVSAELVRAKVVHIKLGKERFERALKLLKEDPDKNYFQLEAQTMQNIGRTFEEDASPHKLATRGKTIVLQLHADEIVKSDVIMALKWCPISYEYFPINFRMKNFLYSYEFERLDTWEHARAVLFEDMQAISGRAGTNDPTRSRVLINDAGWHCSWCMSTVTEVLHKVEHYVHQDVFRRIFLQGKTTGEVDREQARKVIKTYMCTGEHTGMAYPDMYNLKHAFQSVFLDGRVFKQTTENLDAPPLAQAANHRILAKESAKSGKSPAPEQRVVTVGLDLDLNEAAANERVDTMLRVFLPGNCRREDHD